MTLHKIWICLRGLELEVVDAHTSSGYSVANPDLEVMSSRRVHHSARPGLESATVPTGCRFTVLLQTTHLFCTSQKILHTNIILEIKILCTNHITTYHIYKIIGHWKIFRENGSIISSDKILRCLYNRLTQT